MAGWLAGASFSSRRRHSACVAPHSPQILVIFRVLLAAWPLSSLRGRCRGGGAKRWFQGRLCSERTKRTFLVQRLFGCYWPINPTWGGDNCRAYLSFFFSLAFLGKGGGGRGGLVSTSRFDCLIEIILLCMPAPPLPPGPSSSSCQPWLTMMQRMLMLCL